MNEPDPMLEQLKRELTMARETNRRLNRRAQLAESLLEKTPAKVEGAVKAMEGALFVLRRYASEWRDYAKQLKRMLRDVSGSDAELRKKNADLRKQLDELWKMKMDKLVDD